jgi:hypothetical protein
VNSGCECAEGFGGCLAHRSVKWQYQPIRNPMEGVIDDLDNSTGRR